MYFALCEHALVYEDSKTVLAHAGDVEARVTCEDLVRRWPGYHE